MNYKHSELRSTASERGSSVDKSKYPPNWKEIVEWIRRRSGNRCECTGECGLHEGRRCIERNGEPATYAKGTIVLTTAHLDHDPGNNVPDNLKHMCQRCHLRVDRFQHAYNSRITRDAKKGQGHLFGRK